MRLPRQLHPKPSQVWLGLLGGFYLAALFVIAASAYAGAAIFICLGALLLVEISLGWAVWQYRRAPHSLRLGRCGEFQVMLTEGGAWRSARLLPETTSWGFVVVLLCRLDLVAEEGHPERWPRSLLITRDSLPPDDFRALCVWLRWREKAKPFPAEAI